MTQATTVQYKLVLEFYTNRLNFETLFNNFKNVVTVYMEQLVISINTTGSKAEQSLIFKHMTVLASRNTARPGIVSTSSMAFKKRGKEHIHINKTCVKATLIFEVFSTTRILHEFFSSSLCKNMIYSRFGDSQIKSLQISAMRMRK